MNEQDCDRIIDAAAAQMVVREPGRTLTDAVMANVGEPAAPAHRRLIWATAAASVVLCGAIAIAVINRTPAPAIQLPAPALPLVVPPAVVTAPALVLLPETASERSPALVSGTRRLSSAMQLPPEDLSAILPIETQPIALSVIEVPPIENQPTVIADIEIGDITIAPLAASND